MTILSKSYAYSKMEKEDPDEIHHRRAQFLIYKALEKADSSSRRSSKPSWLKVRLSKLKIKIGRRMKRVKKCLFFGMSSKGGARNKQVASEQLTTWKRIFGVRDALVSLAPIFT